jgi:hypothetical protein
MLSYKNPDPYRMFSRSYTKEETAYKDAASAIERWAKEEIEELEIQDVPEDFQDQIDLLRDVLKLLSEGKHKEAYGQWREYADDATPGEDVMIEDTEIVDE